MKPDCPHSPARPCRARRSRYAVALAMALAITGLASRAQGQGYPSAQSIQEEMSASLPEVTKAVLLATGNETGSVYVVGGAYQLVVTLLNSTLANAAARDAEAVKIAAAVSAAMLLKPQFRTIQALHIDYVTREVNKADTQLIDAIDFRKNAEGIFMLHKA